MNYDVLSTAWKIIHYTSYIIHIPCLTMSKSTCKWGCFPFADAKIEPFFQTLMLSIEGKIPKRNERNEKVIFTGTNGIISSVIPSPIRRTEGKFPRAKDTEWVYVKTHTDGKWQKWQMAVYSKGRK